MEEITLDKLKEACIRVTPVIADYITKSSFVSLGMFLNATIVDLWVNEKAENEDTRLIRAAYLNLERFGTISSKIT